MLLGKKRKSSNACDRKAVPQSSVSLHVVFCGLVTLNYHIQFYGLFYEKLLFSFSWIAIKGNTEGWERISLMLAKS